MSTAARAAGLFLAAVGVAGTARATTAASPNAIAAETNSVSVRYHASQLATRRGAHLLVSLGRPDIRRLLRPDTPRCWH